EARGTLVAGVPLKGSFDIDISDVSSQRLHSLLSYCAGVYGNFSSKIHYQSHPHSLLTGDLIVSHGLLDNMFFFSWAADFLSLPSLKQIAFDRLSAKFSANDQSANLKMINLESEDVNFKGYFTLYDNDLTSSKLSLSLSKALLKTSPKFALLLNYLAKDVPAVNFDFQLSGLFEAMNFKWLKSDFKQRLQNLLPGWMERGIENKIAKIIESISEEELSPPE
ncbi:MAG: hypothetical protein ABIC18_01580, partial [Candidatus Omnitrophota bacterium]